MSRSLRFNRDWPPEYGIVCVWQRKSAHAPNIVILLPLYASPTTYKMTPSVKVLHQQTVHQSAPPRCWWAVCVCCVRTSAAHAQVCACELACWIGFSDPGGGQEEEPFVFHGTAGSGGQAGCIPQFFLIGTSWREEFDCGHWEGTLCYITFVTNDMPGDK